MKLYEEFKEYENLWEAYEPTEVDNILWAINDFEFDYEGWEETGVKPGFDPGTSDGYYETEETYEHDDFTYKVDAVSMFEVLRDEILPEHSNKISNSALAVEYKNLETAWENSTKETEDEAGEALDLFLANNLEILVEDFYDELKEYFSERAYEWANDRW